MSLLQSHSVNIANESCTTYLLGGISVEIAHCKWAIHVAHFMEHWYHLRGLNLCYQFSTRSMGFSLNGADFTEFSEFRESTEAWIRINLTVFSVSCLCGTEVESLSLTQEEVDSSTAVLFLKWYYFCHWIQWKHLGKTRIRRVRNMQIHYTQQHQS